jgi:hypothetical protein
MTDDEEVRRIVLHALRGLRDGTLATAKATVIFTGAKVYGSLTTQPEPIVPLIEMPEDESVPFAKLVAWLAEQGGEYTGEELREAAMALQLYDWLTPRTWQTASCAIKFGKLAEQMLNRVFDGCVLVRRGSKNWRRFSAQPLDVVPSHSPATE